MHAYIFFREEMEMVNLLVEFIAECLLNKTTEKKMEQLLQAATGAIGVKPVLPNFLCYPLYISMAKKNYVK
jgi:hypothetical protein